MIPQRSGYYWFIPVDQHKPEVIVRVGVDRIYGYGDVSIPEIDDIINTSKGHFIGPLECRLDAIFQPNLSIERGFTD